MKLALTASSGRYGVPRIMKDPTNFGRRVAPALPETKRLSLALGGRSPVPAGDPHPSWIRYDAVNWIPLVDRTSRYLHDAWKAIESHDLRMAGFKMRAMAADLRDYAVMAAVEDTALCASDQRRAQNASWRLAASALRAGLSASGLESGEIRTIADLRLIFTSASLLDINSRWLFVDGALWYPVGSETRHQFSLAYRAVVLQRREAAATEIYKAIGFLRLEEASAKGCARTALVAAISQLLDLATHESGALTTIRPDAGSTFSAALLALALAHRDRASESWLRGDCHRAGYHFMAAGENLGTALSWLDHRKKLAPSIVAMDLLALGGRLIAGAIPVRDQVLDVIRSFGIAVATLRHEIGLEGLTADESVSTS